MIFRIPRIIGALLAVSIASTVTVDSAPVPHGSGTYLLMRRLHQAHLQGKSTLAASAAAAQYISGRIYLTPHFAIHYTLAPTIHRPLFTPADSSLLRQIDSILAALPPSLTTFQRDSTVNAAFPDSVVPVYVQRAGFHFERAWTYYQDTLQMDMPPGGAASMVFGSTVNSDGARYTVDICDIGSVPQADAAYTAIYGLTFPPAGIHTLLENDFLYGATVNSAGQITGGTAIKAVVNGSVLHDYTVDWDMGIQVTAAHEFSHAVHLNYVYTGDYHDWYELSATAMEEILGPEVNDYFQYLPCIFQKHQTVPLIDSTHNGQTTDNGICEVAPYYISSFFGQGIFAQYLYQFVNKKFDAQLWSTLRINGNNLPAALKATVQFYGKNWDSVYSAYTALFAFAGRPGSAASCTDSVSPLFLRDLPCWTTPTFDTVPPVSKTLSDVVPPLTFRLFKPPAGPSTATRMGLSSLADAVPQKVLRAGSAIPLNGNPVPFFPSSDSSVLCLAVPNASFNQGGSVLNATVVQGFAAYPNPVAPGRSVYFFAPPGSTGSLTIVSESGRGIAELPLDPDGASWTWNLKDGQGLLRPAGRL